MDFRAQGRDWSKTALVILLAVASGVFLFRQWRVAAQTGEAGASVWFYDQGEKRLYALPADTIPPHKGVGGAAGDGVRAIVVAFRAEQANPAKRRIAYLETYSPELAQLLQRVQAARAAHRPYAGPIPSRDSDFFQTNTLVRGPDDPTWQAANTREAQRIMAEWRSWRGPDYQPLVVCVP